MKVSEMYPSNYLKADDLPDDGWTLTINSVEIVKLGDDEKPVITFRETKQTDGKGLVLNRTNADAIAQALKMDDTDDWLGHKIKIYPAETPFNGKMVPCIRVALRAPGKPATAAATAPRPSGGRGKPGVPDYDELPPPDAPDDSVPF